MRGKLPIWVSPAFTPTMLPTELTHCPILYQDRFLLVINKPAGVLSHPNRGRGERRQATAFEGSYDPEARCFHGGAGRVWLIHRLDQDTSGVLLAALDEQTAQRCRALFEEQAIQKNYLAVVRGTPTSPQGVWLDHLATTHARGAVRTTVLKGRPPNAELHYAVKGRSEEHRVSLLDIRLITGRTHQIRVQAASRQHPIAGDDVYGDFSLNRRLRASPGLRRLALHARRLSFRHPVSGKDLIIDALPPPDLAVMLQALT
ncbi:MAG: RluA family pseudouridine synthase [Prosthecobacter sp.]|nr:RluA family pseudouridine synthase [Prosthecobacter sp.]